MTKIELLLEEYTASLRVGVLPHERTAPQRVRVNVKAQLKKPPAGDSLAKTYNYTKIISEIDLLGAKHFDLMETLAATLAKKLIKDPKLVEVEIELVKLDALQNGRVGVRYSFRK